MQHQHRSFYRANRPGNLNISNIPLDQPGIVSPYTSQTDHYATQQTLQSNNNNATTGNNNPPIQSPSHFMNQNHNYGSSNVCMSPSTNSNRQSHGSYINSQIQNSNYSNYSTVSSPHYTQNAPPAPSPSYRHNSNVYQSHIPPNHQNSSHTPNHQYPKQNQYISTPSYDNSQSYTPNFSPCPSSAQIVNKQPHYFTFDTNNNNDMSKQSIEMNNKKNSVITNYETNSNSIQIKSQQQQQHRTYPVPNSPHVMSSSQTSPLNSTSNINNNSVNLNLNQDLYAQQHPKIQTSYQQQSHLSHNNNQNFPQFSDNYHNMPASAIPRSSQFTNINQQNIQCHSVPSSPMNRHHNQSVFEFNPNAVANHLKQSVLQNPAPRIVQENFTNNSQAYNGNKTYFNDINNNNKNEKNNNFEMSVHVNDQHLQKDLQVNKADPLVTTKHYNENDVEMVQEILNDMIQNEENVINSNTEDILSDPISSGIISKFKDDTNKNELNLNGLEEDLVNAPNINIEENSKNNISIGSNFSPNSSNTTSSMLNDTISSGILSEPSHLNKPIPDDLSKLSDTSIQNNNINSLESLTNAANVILNNKEVNNNNQMFQYRNESTESKNASYSLSNLSAAASAEFEFLQYNYDSKMPSISRKENDIAKKKRLPKPALANSKKLKSDSNESFDYSRMPMKGFESIDKNSIFNDKLNGDISMKFNTMEKKNPLNLNNMPDNFDLKASTALNGKKDELAKTNGSEIMQNCPECGKFFANKSALAKHRLIHSSERKYGCYLCEKSFKRQDHLNGHLLTHKDKKPFSCKAPGCDKSYCDSRSLKRHVESQHQDYLEQVAKGNHQVLNFLPNIGKLKANVAPHIHHEIIVKNPNHVQEQSLYSPITPIIDDSTIDQKKEENSDKNRSKNFFTFEEPKPETCKICGKGFKNIPALNGHMRLHGGFIIKSNQSKSKDSSEPLDQISLLNDDSMSSNCSSTSFSSSLSNISFIKANRQKPEAKSDHSKNQYHIENESKNGKTIENHQSEDMKKMFKSKKAKQTRPIQQVAQHNLMKNNQKIDYESQHTLFLKPISMQQPEEVRNYHMDMLKQSNENEEKYLTHSKNFNTNLSYYHSEHIPSHDKEKSTSNKTYTAKPTKNLHQQNHAQNTYDNDITLLKHRLDQSKYQSQSQENQISKPLKNHEIFKDIKHQDTYSHNDVKSGPQKSKPPASSFDPYPTSKILTDILLKKNEFNDILQNPTWLLNAQKNFSHLDETKSNFLDHGLNKSMTNSFEFSDTSNMSEPFSSSTNQNDFQFNNSMKFGQINESKQRNSIESKSSEKNSSLRHKFKPEPLIIPSTISSFQNLNFNLYNNPLLMHSQSMLNPELYHSQRFLSNIHAQMANIYPNATFLKSPRLLNYDVKKQYTPPPMLSPFRKGPGLFCNSKEFYNFFQLPAPPYMRTPLNQSTSCSMISPMTMYNQHINNNLVDTLINQSNITQNQEKQFFKQQVLNQNVSNTNESIEDSPIESETPMKLVINTGNNVETNGADSFFPAEANDQQANDDKEKGDLTDVNEIFTEPFINEGDEYQADIPEFKGSYSSHSIETKEDLLWSCQISDKACPLKFGNFLKLITKNSLLFGESNNLELGLHVLNFYQGDFENSIKTFLNDTIDVPDDCPILTYNYNETEIWSNEEIKKFEEAILVHDKNFSEIAGEVKSKSIKQCVEFYYFWKKVLSDDIRKKWRAVKKNRHVEPSTIQQNLRSNKTETKKSEFKDKTNNLKIANCKNNQRWKIKCSQCNSRFKTKKKLKIHTSAKHEVNKKSKANPF